MLENGGFSEIDGATDDAVEAPVFWTFDDVQAALVEAHDLWRRTPRVGHRPIKSCWPNEMLQRGDGDYDARGGDLAAPAPRPMPLSRAEVAQRDRVSAWLEHVPGEMNRRIVVLAVAQIAGGRSQISWRRVRARLRIASGRGSEGRYRRAVTAICTALNHPDAAALVAKGAGPKEISAACGLSFSESYAIVRQLRG